MQVGPLRSQAETAKRYLVLRDELRVMEISAWMCTLDKLHAQSETVNREYEQLRASLEQAKAELEALYASSGNLTERMHRKDIETEQARERLSSAEALVSECESAIAVLRANCKSSMEQKDRLLRDIREQEDRTGEIRSEIASGKNRLQEIAREKQTLDADLERNSNVLEGCRIKLKSREESAAQLGERLNRLEVDGRSMDGRIRMLSDMEKEYEGYSRAVKTVMRESERGTIRGIHGPVANLLRSDEECALAIETALGAASQNIVIDSQNDGRLAIEMLKRADAGRATFLPLDTIRGSVMQDAPVKDPGFVGIASELVRFDPRYEQIVWNLLGRTVVAESLNDAVRMSKNSGNRLRIVTLDGQMIHAGGSMTGGSSAKNSGFLSRANELEKLKKQRARLAESEKSCADQLEKAKSGLAAVRYQLDMALEDQADLRGRSSSLEAEQRAVENSVRQFSALLDGLTGDSETRRAAVDSAQRLIEDFQRQQREKEEKLSRLRENVQQIRGEIADLSQHKLDLEGKRTRTEKEAQQRNADILDLERQAARMEQKKLSADLEEKQILDKLWENYELSHSAANALRQPVENLSKANKAIAEMRRQMSALGTVNLGAIEEYERVNTRYTFLTGQRDDVEKSKKELLDIISQITGEMTDVFLTRFREIDACFRQTFLELFGGGKASLRLEDESNVLECGIEIKVQPPGKALSNISLLSGGEMAFVAIALYFAILKVRPTPFCVMDEIEAALDEANVIRFAEYLRRMSDKTQFLVITHRRGTMEEADMLYGVTMQEKGVSTVVELDLESAKKTVED